MTFRAYRAAPFNHAHENRIFNRLHDILLAQWGAQDEPLHLFGNFYVDGSEIDALVVKRNALIVIDFKDYGGKLRFSENARWRIDGKEVRGGNKPNPYQQIRDNKYQLLNYLNSKIDFQSSPDLGHIAGLCLFHQDVKFNESDLPHKISRWFHISDISSAVRSMDAIVSSKINFSDSDIDLLISSLDVPDYHPDGRPNEVHLATYECYEPPGHDYLNTEQTLSLAKLNGWLEDDDNKVFSLSGAFYSGKSKVVRAVEAVLVQAGMSPIYLAPNARIANRYKTRGFSDVSSIYSWLYAGRPNDIRNGRQIFPVDRESVDPDKDVIIIFEAHLLSNEFFEAETTIYGSGFILADFINSLRGTDVNESKNSQKLIEFSDLPKILVVGDPYQLTRGAREKSLLGCQIFEQQNIGFIKAELNSQDRDDEAPIEMLDFQSALIGQIKAQKFVQLPICQQDSIKAISKGQHTDNIANSLIQWPRRAAYLAPTNEAAQLVNNGIRAKYFGARSQGLLVAGDIVDIHNRTPNIGANELEWVNAGEFARVIESKGVVQTKSTALKDRESPVLLDFAQATIEFSGGVAEIFYLPDFLMATKPELTRDQAIALQKWAREDADAALNEQKQRLDAMGKEDAKYQEELEQYKNHLNRLIVSSRYANAARLRYAYAITVHRAQAYDPVSRVILNGRSAHDTENPATDSYFRWLYTATTCTSDAMQIVDYPELTPLSKAKWEFDGARLVPITFRPTFYYRKDRNPTDDELATPLPVGFSNPDRRLLSVLLTIYELVEDTDWRVGTITQHNFRERYTFISDRGQVTADLNYDGKYTVSIGSVVRDSGPPELAVEIRKLLATDPIFTDENIENAVRLFQEHLSKKNWSTISVDEKNYKAFLIVEHKVGKIKLEINVPSDSSVSKKGVISSIKVNQGDSKDVVDRFEADFGHG